MNVKLSLVKTTALAFGAALLMVGVVLSLIGVPPAAQAAPAATIQSMIDAAPDGGTVSIPSGTYTESLTVNKTLTLTGVSSGTTIIQAVTGQRVITVTSGHDLRLENLTVTGGQAPGQGGGGIAIISGSLTLANCHIVNNSANYGGGVYQAGDGGRVDVTGSRIELNVTGLDGGGLYVNGSAALTNTQVLSNMTGRHGGGLHIASGRADLIGGLFSNNVASTGNGGAVNLNNSLSITGTQFISNTAANGGGLLQWNAGYTVTMTNARFERNHSGNNGGGLYVSGNAALTNTQVLSGTAGNNGGGLYVNSGRANLIGGLFSNNVASVGVGGGVYVGTGGTAMVNGGHIFSNTASFGGGVYVLNGSATVNATQVLSNTSGNEGGGIFNYGTFTVTNSLLNSNSARNCGGGIGSRSVLALINSTLSGNQTTNPSSPCGGGALDLYLGATTTILNSTIVSNTAVITNAAKSGIWLESDAGPLTIGNSIVAHNNGTNNVKIDGSAVFASLGYNLTNSGAGTPFTVTGDLTNTNPLLGPLQDNGGSTWTHALLPGSPAIDRIPFGTNGCGTSITTDQRSQPRPIPTGGKCDIGAYELQLACRAQIGTGATFDSGDAAAIQTAVDAAPAGDTVKVAGTCAGVQSRAGAWQTVYIAKPLTVRGGYTSINWITSDPIANPTILDARSNGRVVLLANGGALLPDLFMRDGSTFDKQAASRLAAPGGSAGVTGITLENLTVRGGSSGGVFSNYANATLNGMQIVSNTARYGGGVRADGGTLTVINSTVSGNTASSWGGGIAEWAGTLTLINSTLSGNQAPGGDTSFDGGGAMDLYGTPTVTIVNSTIVSNTAAPANVSRSGIWLESGTLNIQNSIVAGNSVASNVKVESPAIFTSQGHNLTNSGAGTPFTATTDLTNTNPLLGPLQDNGGSTWTHALLPGSPAIDRIPFGVNGCGTTLTADQRGQPRPGTFTHLCDIGAYEAQGIHYQIYLPLVIK